VSDTWRDEAGGGTGSAGGAGSGGEAAFRAAYDAVLARWPADVRGIDVPTAYGTTRVHICGPEEGDPLVLLPGGGTTSVVWFANVGELSRTHRVYAVDLIGDIGRSVNQGAPVKGVADLMAWLAELHDALGLAGARLCGHSYGAWMALNFVLHAPHRVDRLALLDPVNCFAGMRPAYLMRAMPLLLRPTAERAGAFRRWESGSASEDPGWQEFLRSAAAIRAAKVVAMRRPKAAALRACTVPTPVLLAEHSRARDVRRVGDAVRRLMPRAAEATLRAASHHSVPTERPAELNRRLAEFLA
jgi:pimeloyl-ACP methyl ester carboxylesterase